MHRKSITKLALLLGSLIFSQSAFAHSPIKGIGFLFNGMVHPFLIPSHVLVILVLGFLIGQLQPQKHRVSILLFLFALMTSLGFSALNIKLPEYDWTFILLLIAVVIGLSALFAINFSVWMTSLAAIFTALLIGFDSQIDDLTGSIKIISLVGNAVGSYLMLLYAVAISETMSVKKWQQIGIRILTSWLSAGALMVLALNLS